MAKRSTIGGTGALYAAFIKRLRALGHEASYMLGVEPATGRCRQGQCWRTRGHGYGAMYCERHGKPTAPGWLTPAIVEAGR